MSATKPSDGKLYPKKDDSISQREGISLPSILSRVQDVLSSHYHIISIASLTVLGVGISAALFKRFRKGSNKNSKGKRGKVQAGAVQNGANGDIVRKKVPKPTATCVALSDGSACVVRRKIPADNSCLFNAVGYCMHGSMSKASFLRAVVAREVSGDPNEYSSAFLGMPNDAYCSWIMNPMNWGGGIELAILAKHYGREIAAWNIETGSCHIFGEEAGFPKQVLLIYNGVHYDSLAISPRPGADQSEDKTEFNPRTKRGKMIIAAASTLVKLAHKASPFYKGPTPAAKSSQSTSLQCTECSVKLAGAEEAKQHAAQTGHVKFEECKS